MQNVKNMTTMTESEENLNSELEQINSHSLNMKNSRNKSDPVRYQTPTGNWKFVNVCHQHWQKSVNCLPSSFDSICPKLQCVLLKPIFFFWQLLRLHYSSEAVKDGKISIWGFHFVIYLLKRTAMTFDFRLITVFKSSKYMKKLKTHWKFCARILFSMPFLTIVC